VCVPILCVSVSLWTVCYLFLCRKIGDLYSKDPVSLELSVEFWCPMEPQFPCASLTAGGLAALSTVQPPQRQVT